MSAPSDRPTLGDPSLGELQAALFLDMVAQHANMALMFLGRVPRPETGELVQDLETARMFIEQLEMLQAKTKGNLNQREETLLKQSLMATRMAFVEAVEKPLAAASPKPEAARASPASDPGQAASPASSDGPAPAPAAQAGPGASSTAAAEAEARKKFVKKY